MPDPVTPRSYLENMADHVAQREGSRRSARWAVGASDGVRV